jgi:hypothetical protein
MTYRSWLVVLSTAQQSCTRAPVTLLPIATREVNRTVCDLTTQLLQLLLPRITGLPL